MGKSFPSTSRLQDFARIISSDRIQRPKHTKPVPRTRFPSSPGPAKPPGKGVRVESPPPPSPLQQKQSRFKKMETNSSEQQQQRREGLMPLSVVVADCVKRWFEDTLKEAKAGDTAMQVLVGQMYHNGYGVSRDPQKGKAWINRASKIRSSAWKVSDKRPGYNVSDSDSDEPNVNPK